ncbi:MAG TPA: 2-hydroxyacid dehydrogenase, partial [Streptosporangiaceae bacterium]|nr:2-hydroxyacid dehydrogenase [Streptosporangiaceae bacterium]
MAGERLVAVSYPVDQEYTKANFEILGDDAEIVRTYELDAAGRARALRDADALLAWDLAEEIPAGALQRAGRLRFVQLLSAGVDAVDFTALPERLTVACNAGAYAGAMSEHVLALTLSLAKHLPQRHAALAAGRYDKWLPALVLDGSVCGILGFGGVGAATARLMRAFGARIHAVNRTGRTSETVEFVGTLADLDQVLAAADVLVVSLPLTLVTRGLLGRRELSLMKPAAILVNVARGAIIDQRALYEHLSTHPQFSAGIDTWWDEPAGEGPFRTDYPFLGLPNVLGSPHNSSIVPGTMLAAARVAAQNVRRYLRGEAVTGVIRRADYQAGA